MAQPNLHFQNATINVDLHVLIEACGLQYEIGNSCLHQIREGLEGPLDGRDDKIAEQNITHGLLVNDGAKATENIVNQYGMGKGVLRKEETHVNR